MKILKFVIAEKWDGEGLKKKHSHTSYQETQIDQHKTRVQQIEHKLNLVRKIEIKLAADLKDAKRRYYQAQEEATCTQ